MKVIFIFVTVCCALSLGDDLCLKQDCSFDGYWYRPRCFLSWSCFVLQCQGGSWVFTGEIDPECNVCYVYDDPHFKTFDAYGSTHYDWHGSCNYSLSQPISCNDYKASYDAPYGIYADFQECNNSPYISCVDTTTYKLDEYTALVIIHGNLPSTIEINGNLVYVPATPSIPYDCTGTDYPAIIWQDGDCVRIVGREYSIQACRHYMFIHTQKDHLGGIAGLCGFYTGEGHTTDDFFTRDCVNAPDINTFAISWLTKEDKEIPDCNTVLVPFECSDEENNEYRIICEANITAAAEMCGGPSDLQDIPNVIESCVKDCCLDFTFCEEWIESDYNFMCDICRNRMPLNTTTTPSPNTDTTTTPSPNTDTTTTPSPNTDTTTLQSFANAG